MVLRWSIKGLIEAVWALRWLIRAPNGTLGPLRRSVNKQFSGFSQFLSEHQISAWVPAERAPHFPFL